MKHLFVSRVFWQITVACFGFLHSSLHIPITFTFSLWRAFTYVCASVGGSMAFSRGACICCFFYIYSSDCARDAVFGVKCAFCSAFYVFCGVFIFLQCVLRLFAACLSFCGAFYVFCGAFNAIFLRPAQLWWGGNGYYTAEKYFLYLFRRFIDKQKG